MERRQGQLSTYTQRKKKTGENNTGKFGDKEIRKLKNLVSVHWPSSAPGVGPEAERRVESEWKKLKSKSNMALAAKEPPSASTWGLKAVFVSDINIFRYIMIAVTGLQRGKAEIV